MILILHLHYTKLKVLWGVTQKSSSKIIQQMTDVRWMINNR